MRLQFLETTMIQLLQGREQVQLNDLTKRWLLDCETAHITASSITKGKEGGLQRYLKKIICKYACVSHKPFKM